jgi:hypothetical protein
MNAHTEDHSRAWVHAARFALPGTLLLALTTTVTVSAEGNIPQYACGARCPVTNADTRDSPGGREIWLRTIDQLSISYTNVFGRLLYVERVGGWVPQTVDTTGSMRWDVLGRDPSGNPCIVYFDETNCRLKFARRSSGTWSLHMVDGAQPNPCVGRYPSMAMNSDGNSMISYYDLTSGKLKFAFEYPQDTWTLSTIDSGGRVGLWTSMVPAGSGTICGVSYYDSTRGELKVAVLPVPSLEKSAPEGVTSTNGWEISVVDSGNVGAYSAMAGTAGNERVAYRDRANNTIKFAWRNYRGAWTIEVVDQVDPNPVLPDGDPAYQLSIAMLGTGPDSTAITYYDPVSRDLRVAIRRQNPDPTYWRVATLDTTGDVGRSSSCAIRSNDSLYVAYRDVSEDALKFLAFSEPFYVTTPASPIYKGLYATDGIVRATVAAAGTLYLGGSFTQVGRPTGGGAPLDVTTGQPKAFPQIAGAVYTVIPDGAGGWYVGGQFTHVAGVPRSNLAHLRSDYSVSDWNPNPNGAVRTMLRDQVNRVYVGGSFTTIYDQARNRLACLYGWSATDPSLGVEPFWDPNANGDVNAMTMSATVLYAGGAFTSIGGQPRNRVAAFDLTVFERPLAPWNPNANGDVHALALGPGVVYVGGSFSSIGGQTRLKIAAIDASGLATAWDPTLDNSVRALAVGPNQVYAGGDFNTIHFQTHPYLVGIDPNTGLLTSFHPSPDGPVHALALSGGSIYAGGDFTTLNTVTIRNHIARMDTASGNPASWNPDGNGRVATLAVDGTTVFAGGSFKGFGWPRRANLAALDMTSGAVTSWNPGSFNSGDVRALAASGGTIYVGGDFGVAGGQPRSDIAAIDAGSGLATSWSPEADGLVNALTVHGSLIYVGGEFGMIGGASRSMLAALDLATGAAMAWNPNGSGSGGVQALAAGGGRVYAGGGFAFFGSTFQPNLAVLDSVSGAVVPSPYPDGAALALALGGGRLYVGGAYSNLGGSPGRLRAIDVASVTVVPWSPDVDGTVHALAWSGSTLLAGGEFTHAGGEPRSGFAALDTATGAATDLDPQPDGTVHTIAVGGARAYLGGDFARVGGLAQYGIACAIPLGLVDAPAPEIIVAPIAMVLSPNPMSRTTRIDYTLPQAGPVRIDVFDVQGRVVARLVDQPRPAGAHTVTWVERHPPVPRPRESISCDCRC